MAALAQEVARATPELEAAFERAFEEILAARGGDRKRQLPVRYVDRWCRADSRVQNQRLSKGDSREGSPERKLMIVNWRQQGAPTARGRATACYGLARMPRLRRSLG